MVPIEMTLPQSQLTLHGFQSKPGAAVTLVSLHGWLDNCFSFRPLSALLPDYNLIAFDLPGHGRSQFIPDGMSYDFHFYVVWLQELLDVLQKEKVVILGHSMGAVIASLYAGVFPERLSSLILIEGLGPFSVAESQAPAKMRAYIEGWSKQRSMRNGLFKSWEDAVSARQKSGRLTQASAEILAERGTQAVEDGYMWTHDPRLKLPSRYQFSEAQILAFLGQIQCPTLYIEASASMLTEQVALRHRALAISHLRQVKLDGGHHLHLDDPVTVAKAIKGFFNELT